MAKSQNQKLKLIYLARLMQEKTDDEHGLSMSEIISELSLCGVKAERKSIYDDFEALRSIGMDIEKNIIGNRTEYYLAGREFELPELKLLVDAVQSSKFITRKKSEALIKKIEGLTSKYEAKKLSRNVHVTNRIKNMNESIYYTVDDIHNAINRDKQISFKYFKWNADGEKELRRGGKTYQVSPWALTWDDENYYLVAFDAEAGIIKHYRVDKMADITMTDQPQAGAEAFAALDMGVYAKKVFGMFSGQERPVKLRVANHLVGAMLDRFGKEISIVPDGDNHFTLLVNVIISPQFFGWVCAFGSDIEILEPASVQEQFLTHLDGIRAQYQ